jgi:hypothetical protein
MDKKHIMLVFLRRAGALPKLAYDAKVVEYDQSRRKSPEERRARKSKAAKQRAREDRRRHNEKVIKEYNLKKDRT